MVAFAAGPSAAALAAVASGSSTGVAPPGAAAAGAGTAAPAVRAAAAVLVDVRTGRVLYARAAHQRMAPASTTKIMTALLVLERLGPQATVTVDRDAAALRTGSHIGLAAGERWTTGDLLRVMLLRSANDAAAALAGAVAGDQSRFAVLMTARARSLGARHTRFANAHGLDHPEHYTTAADLALISRHALRAPAFAEIVRTPVWTLVRPDGAREDLENRNRLLGRYPGADGVKTGSTRAAGNTIVASATRDGWQLLAAVLRSDDHYGDASRLLDFGFASFISRRLAARGEPLAPLDAVVGAGHLVAVPPADVHAVVRRGATLTARVALRPDLRGPITPGTRVGTVEFVEDAALVVARSVLVATERRAR
ncbi:MAG: D-alanyl-D-alanine carboxypeptidase family protein [Armatimonadota bacterium]|nr:D-alanyl-D-alanine carboxypeptidase family protein [Armatimonadota bacterium]